MKEIPPVKKLGKTGDPSCSHKTRTAVAFSLLSRESISTKINAANKFRYKQRILRFASYLCFFNAVIHILTGSLFVILIFSV